MGGARVTWLLPGGRSVAGVEPVMGSLGQESELCLVQVLFLGTLVRV